MLTTIFKLRSAATSAFYLPSSASPSCEPVQSVQEPHLPGGGTAQQLGLLHTCDYALLGCLQIHPAAHQCTDARGMATALAASSSPWGV